MSYLLNKKGLAVCFLLVISILFPLWSARGEEQISFDLETNMSRIGIAQDIMVTIVVKNKTAKPINAIEATLLVPKQYFQINDLWLGSSVVSLWIEKPKIKETADSWVVHLSGVIPGGNKSEKAEIFKIILKSDTSLGTSVLKLMSPKIFLHNTEAESIDLSDVHKKIEIVSIEKNGNLQEIIAIDEVPPEPFVPIVASDTTVYGGDYFVIFDTLDRQSGLSHFEIIESSEFYAENQLADNKDLVWKAIDNPYRLVDQSLSSFIYIKAVDMQRNSRVVIIPPTNYLKKNLPYPIIRNVVIVIGVFGLFFFLRKRKHEISI